MPLFFMQNKNYIKAIKTKTKVTMHLKENVRVKSWTIKLNNHNVFPNKLTENLKAGKKYFQPSLPFLPVTEVPVNICNYKPNTVRLEVMF